MNKLSNFEIARVFSLYPLQPILLYDGDEPVPDVVEGVDFIRNELIAERIHFDFDKAKLVLRSLSDATDDECLLIPYLLEGVKYTLGDIKAHYQGDLKVFLKPFFTLDYNISNNKYHPFVFFSIYAEFLKMGFDIPLWFGVDHWANGKTAVELGLAIYKNNKN